VQDLRRLAVYGLAAHYLGPEGLSDRLVAQADAEDGDLAGELLDYLDRGAGLLRRARTGRDHYPIWVELEDLFRRDLVVAPDEYLPAQLPEVLDQVVREGVVVVDDQNPHVVEDFSR
jgi:hypothetical protein